MALEVPVFIDLENRAARVINRSLQGAVQEQTRGLSTAVRQGDTAGAARLIDQINFGPAAEEIRSELELLSLNMVLLGAAQFTEGHEARGTRFVRDREIPPEIQPQVEQIIRSLDGSQTEAVRLGAQRLVAEAEAEDPTVAGSGVSDFTLFKVDETVATMERFAKVAGATLASRLNAAVDAGTKLQANVSANLLTSRMVAFGALSQATAGGITTYQWNAVLDSRTCPFCQGMNGKTFSVQPALRDLRTIIGSQDPGVAKALSPWPNQNIASINRLAGLTDEKLQEEGFAIPPAHPRCRCVLSIVGTVPRSEIRGFQVRPVPRASAVRDFATVEAAMEGLGLTREEAEEAFRRLR